MPNSPIRIPRFATLLLICFCLALVAPSVSVAQSSNAGLRSVEVVGTGKASAKPEVMVLKGFLKAEGKTAKKVMSEFHKTKTSLEETINPMDFADVEIEFLESLFNTNLNAQEAMMGAMGGGGKTASDGYKLSQAIRIRIPIEEDGAEKSTLDMLTKLIDAGETVGVAFDKPGNPMMGIVVGGASGTSSLATGEMKDPAAIKNRATKQAFVNAKAEAEKLAELAGGKLGKVISIQASAVTEKSDDPTSNYMNMIMGMSTAASQTESFNRIQISQSLQVKFELID